MTDNSSTGPMPARNRPTETNRQTKARTHWTSADIKHEFLLRNGDWLAEHDAEVRAEAEAEGFVRGQRSGLHIGLGLPASPAVDHADVQVKDGIPRQFVLALQHGTRPPYDNPMDAPTVNISGRNVTLTLTDKGTGTPEPETAAAWKGLRSVVEDVIATSAAGGYISDHVRVLPRQIGVAIWADDEGRTVRVQAAGATYMSRRWQRGWPHGAAIFLGVALISAKVILYGARISPLAAIASSLGMVPLSLASAVTVMTLAPDFQQLHVREKLDARDNAGDNRPIQR